MVVQASRTQKGVIKHSEDMLKQAQAKLLGYILTNIQYTSRHTLQIFAKVGPVIDFY